MAETIKHRLAPNETYGAIPGALVGLIGVFALIRILPALFGSGLRLPSAYWVPAVVASAVLGAMAGMASAVTLDSRRESRSSVEAIVLCAFFFGIGGGLAGFIGGIGAFALPTLWPVLPKRVDATASVFFAFFLAPIFGIIGGFVFPLVKQMLRPKAIIEARITGNS